MQLQRKDKADVAIADLAHFETKLAAAVRSAGSDQEAVAAWDQALADAPTVELVSDAGVVLRRATIARSSLALAPRFHPTLSHPVGTFAGRGVERISTVHAEYECDPDSGLVLSEVKR